MPVKVKAEMIGREAPIYLSYTLKQKAQVKVLLINEKGDVVKSFLPHTTLAGSESVTNLGRWSDVKEMGNYAIAIATDKPAYETFAKIAERCQRVTQNRDRNERSTPKGEKISDFIQAG